tara:strand:+ start:65 stop:673 length:609 start_codon:yes stop_codon:yes gene_type:complete
MVTPSTNDDQTVMIFMLIMLVICCCCSSSSFLITGGFLFTRKEEDGEDENILPSDFDWNCYQDRYVDLIDKNKSEVEKHYLDTGKSESRTYTCDDIVYGLPQPNAGHVWKEGGASSYDDCRKYAKNKGHVAFAMQTRHHDHYPDSIGDNKGKYGCWSIKDFATAGHTGKLSASYNGDKNEIWQDKHVAGCSNSNKKFTSKCQ